MLAMRGEVGSDRKLTSSAFFCAVLSRGLSESFRNSASWPRGSGCGLQDMMSGCGGGRHYDDRVWIDDRLRSRKLKVSTCDRVWE